MKTFKTYLNVPFAQKDTVKLLGGRWDPSIKKWYVPNNIDITLFAKWQTDSFASETISKLIVESNVVISSAISSTIAAKGSTVPVFTNPVDKGFEAYNGDEPPWE
jgi:hypothetical protein